MQHLGIKEVRNGQLKFCFSGLLCRLKIIPSRKVVAMETFAKYDGVKMNPLLILYFKIISWVFSYGKCYGGNSFLNE